LLAVYLLYVDESGSHGAIQGNRAYVLAGLAVHEDDAARLQRALAELVARHVPPGADAGAHELHAAEIRHPKRARSVWIDTNGKLRRRVLEDALDAIARFPVTRADRPVKAFAVTLDPADHDVQRHAFKTLLDRFDAFLDDCADAGDPHNGIAIADESHLELQIQRWAEGWRETTTAVGQLDHLADVPLFANSKATRLLQGADLVAWSVWRAHGADPPDPAWMARLGGLVDVQAHGAYS
jgi:hypothetical protein